MCVDSTDLCPHHFEVVSKEALQDQTGKSKEQAAISGIQRGGAMPRHTPKSPHMQPPPPLRLGGVSCSCRRLGRFKQPHSRFGSRMQPH